MRRSLLSLVLLAFAACASDGQGGDLSYAAGAKENYDKGMEELEDGNYLEAIKYFDHVRSKYPYSSYAAVAELKAADTQFERERYTEAIDSYRNFIKFHPTHPSIDWASFRIGESHFEAMPSSFVIFPPPSEKDQTQIRAAKGALEEFVARHPKSGHQAKARELLSVVTRRLAEHELYVARFYQKRERWEAVVGRYEYLLRYYPGMGYDAEAALGIARAWRELGDKAKAKDALQKFLEKHPADPQAGEAKLLLGELG
jgi:outer membrane protein assembly factor BamD